MKNDNAKIGSFVHVAILVEDMDVAIANLTKLGFGPFDPEVEFEGDTDLAWCNGEKIHMSSLGRVTKCNNFGLEWELIQPGESGPYREWFDEHGPGLHHVMIVPDDNTTYEELVEKCVDMTNGRKLFIDGRWEMPTPPDLQWAYVDMNKEIGMVLEVAANTKNFGDD